jgi:hypothetical protein
VSAISCSKDDFMLSKIERNFFEANEHNAIALAAASDILDLEVLDGPPAQHYLARFKCKGLVRAANGNIEIAKRFDVGIWLPDNYQEEFDPVRVLFWFGPRNVLHPNIAPPVVCPGHAYPGMPLVELLYQLFEMITWRKVKMDETDALNRPACIWARNNGHRYPVDNRPLKRRTLTLDVATVPGSQGTPA